MIRDADGNLQCHFGFDFVSYTMAAASTSSNIKDAFLRIPWWLALLELEALGHRFGEDDETELPCRFSGLVRLIRRTRQERPEATVRNKLETSDAIAAALMANARFHHKLSGHDLFMYALRSKTKRFLKLDAVDCNTDQMATTSSLVPEALAKAMAEEFGKFINAFQLQERLTAMTTEQILVLALFHGHMRSRAKDRIAVTEHLDLVRTKPRYVPAADVCSPAVPHFAKVAEGVAGASEHAPEAAVMQAPVICQLCGQGFLDNKGLWKHAAAEHHSWAEYRKRLIYEVGRRVNVPLQPVEKRRLVGTACMIFSIRTRAETRSSQAATQCGRSQRAPCVPGRAGWRISIPATFSKNTVLQAPTARHKTRRMWRSRTTRRTQTRKS